MMTTAQTILLLFLCPFSLVVTLALDIDHTVMTPSWGGQINQMYMQAPWISIVSRMENMVRVKRTRASLQPGAGPSPTNIPIPSMGGVCGPRNNSYILSRHVSQQDQTKLNIGNWETLIIYLYIDVAAPDCIDSPGTIAYAHVCSVDQFNFRPVMGYINVCMPDWTNMYNVLSHEIIHLLGFSSSFFSLSFPYTFDTYGGVGSPENTLEFARKHYSCSEKLDETDFLTYGFPTLDGSHLDPWYVGNDVMTPCDTGQSTPEPLISEITVKILEVTFFSCFSLGVF